MIKKLGLCAAMLLSLNAHAVVADYTFGDYAGTAGGMGGINLSTIKGNERLTLGCYDSKFILSYATLDNNYQATYEVNSEEGLNDMTIIVDGQAYDPSNSDLFSEGSPPARKLFDRLKSSTGKETVIFSSRQSGESVPFSTLGLNEALDMYSYDDCINWFK